MNNILLIEPPTFPKGTISLSPFIIAAAFSQYKTQLLDLNFHHDEQQFHQTDFSNYAFIGLKVSAQNYSAAANITAHIKSKCPAAIIIWGGELPTLLPETCLQHADTIISGLFEPVAESVLIHLSHNQLQEQYTGKNLPEAGMLSPYFSILKNYKRYNRFMGLPMETSRGCPEKCTFCMVLNMQQKHYHLKSIAQLQLELPAYSNRFINIVDYNFGVNKQHVIQVAEAIEKSDALGWMAEMNIELLDNDDMLQAMKRSRCRMIYCGLESVDEEALDSVNKAKTNHVANYERIIRKAQSYGINIAAGIIIGLDEADEASYYRTLDFFSRMGIIYAKFTFLTFNPGTRVKNYMNKQGSFITEQIEQYDGNHLTYLPACISPSQIYSVTRKLIHNYYSFSAIVRRSQNGPAGILNKAEYILFNLCYRNAYIQWLSHDTLGKPENFNKLLLTTYKKPFKLSIAETLLNTVRFLRKILHI